MNTNGGTILSRTSVAANKGGWKSNPNDDENSYPSSVTSTINSKELEDRDDGKDHSSEMKMSSSSSSSSSLGEQQVAYYQEEEISNNGDESNVNNYSDDYEPPLEELDSEQQGIRRIIYGNVESHSFDREQLIHEHYYDQIIAPSVNNGRRWIINFAKSFAKQKTMLMYIASLICLIIYQVTNILINVCVKNLIYLVGSLIYSSCSCNEYSQIIQLDDRSSTSSADNATSNGYRTVMGVFQSRPMFERFWQGLIDYFWKFIFSDQYSSLQELTDAIQIRKDFSRTRNFNFPRYSDNTITNTKYRWYNFLWKSISAQFSLRMNQYFLALACLQFWKAASPTNPITTWIPLILVVAVGVAKELIDDYFRYQKDSEINSKSVTIIRHGKCETIPSYQVQAGDIVYLQDDEQIRADMVLIHSSNVLKKEISSNVTGGIAWVETSALDGESHYKEKKSIGAIQKLLTSTSTDENEISKVNEFSCIIECNAPNADLDHFKGEIIIPYKNRMDRYTVTSNNILLQGTTLKSTTSALAVVIYTGNETKIGMNRKEAEMKWTKMDNFINHVVVGIFIVQFSIGLAFGLIGNYLYFSNGKNMFYLNTSVDFQHSSKLVTGYYIIDSLEYLAEKILPYLIIPLRFTMLCSLMIPQSLKITSDVAKYIISMFFIPKDDLLCDTQGNRTSASNTSVAEDLGQIDYIFSDKTGTLTDNLLTLSRVIVDAKVVDASVSHHSTSNHKIGFLKEQCNFTESTLEFLRNLALCHTVYCDNSTSGSFIPHYRSSSPEEDAFVKYAASQGVVLNYRDEEKMVLRIHSDADNFTLEEYSILKVIHFTSDRRRMSVIVKRISEDPNQSKYYIFCKGADDVICERMNNQVNNEILQETLSHIQNLASNEGLRVMLMVGKELAIEEVNLFIETISHTEEGEQQLIIDSIEKEFILHGATAMEDKLQEGVGECIDSLREAGISIWMLTGDKMETAVQIAHACHLVPSLPQELIDISYLKGNSLSTVRDSLKIISEKYDELGSNIFKCLVFEGRVLNFIVDEESTDLDNISTFLKLCKSVNACVCCRMTPKLKGKIVRLIKYPLSSSSDANDRLQSLSSPICLAIGDGGNDCNMILEADVGIGISSSAKIDEETHQEINTESEHLQAVRAADFGIPRFSVLKRLLLVHGRNSYKRLALISQYTMYKSVVLAACQLVYNLFFTYFSGNTILQSHSLVFYNILYTSVVPFAFSMGDVRIGDLIRYVTPASLKLGSSSNGHSLEVSDMALEKIPELYRSSRRGETLTRTSLFLWFLNGAYQGFIIVLFTCFGIGYGSNILSRTQYENSLNNEISRFGKFKNDLEHINSLMIFIIVSVQYFTVMIMERCNHVKFQPGNNNSSTPRTFSLLNMKLSAVIMGLSICVFLIVNSMSFLGGNLGHLEGRLWRVFLVLGDYALFYLIALIVISLCILPCLIVMWGIRDGSFLLLLKNLKHCVCGNSTYAMLSTTDSDDEPLEEADRLLLRYNVSAFVRHQEEQFYSSTDANNNSETLDQFYGRLRRLVRQSMDLSEL